MRVSHVHNSYTYISNNYYLNTNPIFINDEEFVDLRDVRGWIFHEVNHVILENINKYISNPMNVKYINDISKKLNKCKYFDVDPFEITNENGKIEFNELMKYMNPSIPQFRHLNIKNINFYPIWHYNCSERLDYTKHELYCHKSILIDMVKQIFPIFLDDETKSTPGFDYVDETFMILRRNKLRKEMMNYLYIAQNNIVFDTICCKTSNIKQMLTYHQFDPIYDEIILEVNTTNSINIYEYLKSNLGLYSQCFVSFEYFYRKIVVTREQEKQLMGKILDLLLKLPVKIITNNINRSTIDYFLQINPNATCLRFGYRKIPLQFGNDGKIYVTVNQHKYELTKEVIGELNFV